MKKLLFLISVCLVGTVTVAQMEFRNSNLGRMVNLVDLEGRPLLKQYDPGIGGSPFINPNWFSARLILSAGKVVGPITVNLNIESNVLYFLDSAGRELIAPDGLVKKLTASISIQKTASGAYFGMATRLLINKSETAITRL